MQDTAPRITRPVFLVLAFLEGVSVMFVELLGGKMLVPWFGQSLVVWTSTLGVTMTALALGYALGSRLTGRPASAVILYALFSAAAAWMALMPTLAPAIIHTFGAMDLHTGAVLSTASLLALPLLLLGTTPPLLIGLMGRDREAGMSSGTVFAMSTIGGISCALGAGFFLIGRYGLTLTLVLAGTMILGIAALALRTLVPRKALLAAPLALLLPAFGILLPRDLPAGLLYHSEGLAGQLRVIANPQDPRIRTLQVNGISQTNALVDTSVSASPISMWWYVHLYGAFASHKPEGSKALVLGMGGGSVVHELLHLGFSVDAVEIDPRLPAVAHDHFLLDTSRVGIHIDDARHFIRATEGKEKYDLCIIDVAKGEVQPYHLFTREGLTDLRRVLAEDAVLMMTFLSNPDEPGQPYLSLFKTIAAAGYDVVAAVPHEGKPTDYIFVASPGELPASIYDDARMNPCCQANEVVQEFRRQPRVLLQENLPLEAYVTAPVLVDDLPLLQRLNRQTIKEWRLNMLQGREQENTPVFQ